MEKKTKIAYSWLFSQSSIRTEAFYSKLCRSWPFVAFFQGALKEKDTELNIYSIFSISTYNELYLCILILNCLKLERAVIFIKYIASAIPLNFWPKTLKENSGTCIKFAIRSRYGGKWAREDFLWQYLTILF